MGVSHHQMMVGHTHEKACLAHQRSPTSSIAVSDFLNRVVPLNPAPDKPGLVNIKMCSGEPLLLVKKCVMHRMLHWDIIIYTHYHTIILTHIHIYMYTHIYYICICIFSPPTFTKKLGWKRGVFGLQNAIGPINRPHCLREGRDLVLGTWLQVESWGTWCLFFLNLVGIKCNKDTTSKVQFAPVPIPSSAKYKNTPTPWTMHPVKVIVVP